MMTGKGCCEHSGANAELNLSSAGGEDPEGAAAAEGAAGAADRTVGGPWELQTTPPILQNTEGRL